MTINSRYLDKFKKLAGNEGLFKLHGGRVLIELIQQEEIKTAGGIIVSAPRDYVRGTTAESSRGTLGLVLLAGAGYYDMEGNEVSLDVKTGALVLVNDFGLKCFSALPGLKDYTANSIAMIDDSMIQMSWSGVEDYAAFSKLLE